MEGAQKGSAWTLWPACPCSFACSLWFETQDPQKGAQIRVYRVAMEESREWSYWWLLSAEDPFPMQWCTNSEICRDKNGRFSKHQGVVQYCFSYLRALFFSVCSIMLRICLSINQASTFHLHTQLSCRILEIHSSKHVKFSLVFESSCR